MPTIQLNANLKPETGDLILVDPNTLVSRMAIRLFSTPSKKCHTYHAGQITSKRAQYSNTWITHTLNIHNPRATIDNLYSYLAALRQAGGRYVIIRPAFLMDLDLHEPDRAVRYRETCDSLCMMYEGMPYPLWDLWVIFKRISGLQKLFPFSRERWTDYCIQGCRKVYRNNQVFPWCPDVLDREELPAAVHFEKACCQGFFELIAESHVGFWRELLTE
jgi:hypothetical protein